jgi:quinoprotein glucose dehydrogenase
MDDRRLPVTHAQDAEARSAGGHLGVIRRCLCLLGILPLLAQAQTTTARTQGEWPTYGADPGATKYSPLTQIDRSNVVRLEVAWRWKVGESPIRNTDSTKAARPGNFQATPLMIGDTLFFSTSFNRVVAMDATSGKPFWIFDPKAYTAGQPSNGTGFVHRGVAAWTDGHERRIFMNSRWNLIALDAATGKPIRSFGDTGVVDLVAGLRRAVKRVHYTNTSPPVIYRDLVIVGNGVGDRLVYKNDPPGDVQAFDVHTGKRAWIFHTVPDSSEFGVDTWENGSWRTTGHTNVWAPFSVDVARGLVYLPVSTPSNDWYGGDRLGNGLFGESIVCIDANTGKRRWHYQLVHHGLWDYDPPAPPVLGTIHVNGRTIDAVAVPTKMGFLFVFDRVTGKPVWPITEQPVPKSDVPGERASLTQPVPTLPAPFAMQGFSETDVVDFTPAIKQRALDVVRRYKLGPMFTPPSLQGTVVMPGAIGGAGWGGGAFDPETGTIYIKATNSPALYTIFKTGAPSDTVDASYMVDLPHSSLGVVLDPATRFEIPVVKPPYGTLTAIDLNTGSQKWQITLGDAPEIRRHPMLKDVALPPLLGVAGAPGAIVTKGGLLFVSGGGSVLYAIDKTTGKTLWSAELGRRAYAVPMTYRARDGRQYVVIATGASADAELVAFALPALGTQR